MLHDNGEPPELFFVLCSLRPYLNLMPSHILDSMLSLSKFLHTIKRSVQAAVAPLTCLHPLA